MSNHPDQPSYGQKPSTPKKSSMAFSGSYNQENHAGYERVEPGDNQYSHRTDTGKFFTHSSLVGPTKSHHTSSYNSV